MNPYIVHHVVLAEANQTVRFSTTEDYRLISGLTAAGQFVYPNGNPAYIVPCGVSGLKHIVALGPGGAAIQYFFPAAVVAVQVATSSNLPPVVDIVLASRVNSVQGSMGLSQYNEDKIFVGWPAHPADEVLPLTWYKNRQVSEAEGNPASPTMLLNKTVAEIQAMGWAPYDAFGEQS